MNRLFEQRRARMLTYQAMREGRLPAGRQLQCPKCGGESAAQRWNALRMVCPLCGYHRPCGGIYPPVADFGSWLFPGAGCGPWIHGPAAFPRLWCKVERTAQKTGMGDAAVSALGSIEGHRAVFVVLDSRFLMGSMGTAVGEKVTRATQQAGRRRLPLILFAASGGARMQEGILSLMQMAKTAAAIDRFQKQGGLYISCLTHPTTGGVTASFASLGDIMLAEPGALIGFAGPRVIEQTIGEKLPEGFQSAAALLQNGFLDQIVPRDRWRAVLLRCCCCMKAKKEAQRCERKNRKKKKRVCPKCRKS